MIGSRTADPVSRERLTRFLVAVGRSPSLEASWLNTLSLLEFIGARKIGKTVAGHHPSTDVLQHWADETRHAQAFRRLAEAVAGGPVDEYLAPEAAKGYFYELDRGLAEWIRSSTGQENPQLCYLTTTAVIERRAMQIYPMLKASSSSRVVREELGRIVAEEQSHRSAIEEACVAELKSVGLDFAAALAHEERLFDALLSTLEREVAKRLGAADAA